MHLIVALLGFFWASTLISQTYNVVVRTSRSARPLLQVMPFVLINLLAMKVGFAPTSTLPLSSPSALSASSAAMRAFVQRRQILAFVACALVHARTCIYMMVAKTVVTEEGTGPVLFRPLTLSTTYTIVVFGVAAVFPRSIGESNIDVGIGSIILVNAVTLVYLCATTVKRSTEALGIPFFNANVQPRGVAAGTGHAEDKAHAS